MINISLLFDVFLLVVCSTWGSGGYKWANRRRSVPDYRLPPPISRFDRYVTMVLKGYQIHAEKLLTEDERAGLSLFLDRERTHCLRCHNGPWFTNGGFINIGTDQQHRTAPPRVRATYCTVSKIVTVSPGAPNAVCTIPLGHVTSM